MKLHEFFTICGALPNRSVAEIAAMLKPTEVPDPASAQHLVWAWHLSEERKQEIADWAKEAK